MNNTDQNIKEMLARLKQRTHKEKDYENRGTLESPFMKARNVNFEDEKYE